MRTAMTGRCSAGSFGNRVRGGPGPIRQRAAGSSTTSSNCLSAFLCRMTVQIGGGSFFSRPERSGSRSTTYAVLAGRAPICQLVQRSILKDSVIMKDAVEIIYLKIIYGMEPYLRLEP